MTTVDPRDDWGKHAMGGPSLDLPLYGYGPEAVRRVPPQPKRPEPAGPNGASQRGPTRRGPRPPRGATVTPIDVADVRKAVARTVKAARLAAVLYPQLWALGSADMAADIARGLKDEVWAVAASDAQVTIPGPVTKAMVAELLALRHEGAW